MKKILFFLSLAAMTCMTACHETEPEEPKKPLVVTEQASDVKCYSAYMNASLNVPTDLRGADVYAVFSVTCGGDTKVIKLKNEVKEGAAETVTCFLETTPNTTYAYRAGVCVKGDSIVYGQKVEFTTKPLTFSVGPNKFVEFAQFNINYVATRTEWSFATSYVASGVNNVANPTTSNNPFDLFGWGTGNNPILRSIMESDYPTFNDWGANFSGGWRTLTADEWEYLIFKRPNASALIATAVVDQFTGPRGLLIYPDQLYEGREEELKTHDYDVDWDKDAYIYTFITTESIQEAGMVFLPFGGVCMGSTMDKTSHETDALYWSSTPSGNSAAKALYIEYGKPAKIQSVSRTLGGSVRLVKDVKY